MYCGETLKAVFRFLHLLTTLVDQIDTTANYHFNPRGHDDDILRTLAPLFDAVHHT